MSLEKPIGPEAILEKKKKYIMPCLAHFYKEPRQFVKGEMQYLFTLSIYNNALHQVEQKNYQYAVDLWKYLLSILPQSDSRRSQIERFINENEKRIMLQ